MTVYYFFIFILGLGIGSFLNSVIYRLDKKESVFKGRSKCPKCRKKILWYDNIPLLSFFLLKGSCRNCQKKISWQYPLVEFFTAEIFLINSLILINKGDLISFDLLSIINLVSSFVISSFLIVIFVYDLKHYLILDKVVLPLAIFALVVNFLNFSFVNLAIAGIIGLGFFLIQFIISKGKWIGSGDIRLGLAMGFILGFPKILIGLFFAYFIGSIVAVILIITTKKGFKSKVPFGPFLAIGTYLTMLFGDIVIRNYFHL
jgi:prepilin signal peptidase PulO-like enzyme (type II secretory pathway)